MDGQSGSDIGQGNAGVDDSSDDGRFQFQHVKTRQPYCNVWVWFEINDTWSH